jgi:hypothetical protein
MVVSHLTDTESRFFLNPISITTENIQWHELFVSTSLCHYGLQHYTEDCPVAFLEAIVTTAPYEALVLLDVAVLFHQTILIPVCLITRIIYMHRPIPILAYILYLFTCSCHDSCADEFCDDAAASNNIEALSWLRDPDTSDGVYPWTHHTCASAAKNGHIDMLERLRDPRIDGGVCPWGTHVCWCAAKAGQLDTLIWLRNPDKGNGVCPWNKAECLSVTRSYIHPTIAAWIMAQPDDD